MGNYYMTKAFMAYETRELQKIIREEGLNLKRQKRSTKQKKRGKK